MIPIAYCIHNLSIGGAEHHLQYVFRNIDRRRFLPILFCLGNSHDKPLYEGYKALDVEIINVGMEGKSLSPRNFQRLWDMARLLKAKNVRIVHGYLFEGNLWGAVAGRLAGVPIVIESKRSLDHYSFLPLWACKFGNHLATRITANSHAVKNFVEQIEACPGSKITVIHNGVNGFVAGGISPDASNLRKSWGIPPEAFVAGTVARFFWKKGYEYFLHMAAAVLKEKPKVYFVAIGDGPLKKDMEHLAADLGIASQVIFAGWQSDAGIKTKSFDLYVCTSVIEGMSNAMLEAMNQGLPVVASSVGGNKETVLHSVTGYLVPSRDPKAMAMAVLRLIDNPSLLRRMGEVGKARVASEYTAQGMVRRMEELYMNLLKEKRIEVHERS